MALIIHATNIHQGGGRTLLLPLLKAAMQRGDVRAVLLDERLDTPVGLEEDIQVFRYKPTLSSRFSAERALSSLADRGDTVLCFGGLPPLFKQQAQVLLFVQNRYLTGGVSIRDFPLRVKIRITGERLVFRRAEHTVDRIVVQTPTMHRSLTPALQQITKVMPLFDPVLAQSPSSHQVSDNRPVFLYVASGEPHKNHRALVEGWKLLVDEGISMSLRLTLAKSDPIALRRWIEQQSLQYGLDIDTGINRNQLDAQALYAKSDVLIYPSRFESFGLPLLEAKQAGLSIIAAERDYVRDVVVPAQSFDPESPVSIARAVKRYLCLQQVPTVPLDSVSFLRVVCEEERYGG